MECRTPEEVRGLKRYDDMVVLKNAESFMKHTLDDMLAKLGAYYNQCKTRAGEEAIQAIVDAIDDAGLYDVIGDAAHSAEKEWEHGE